MVKIVTPIWLTWYIPQTLQSNLLIATYISTCAFLHFGQRLIKSTAFPGDDWAYCLSCAKEAVDLVLFIWIDLINNTHSNIFVVSLFYSQFYHSIYNLIAGFLNILVPKNRIYIYNLMNLKIILESIWFILQL